MLKKNLHCSVTLTPGNKGDFEVFADGTCIYSKVITKKIPRPEAVLHLLTA